MTAETIAVTQILYIADQAFDGSRWHSVVGNLRAVTPDDWLWVPPDGRRSIRDIVGHLASCKMMYENHAFGDAALTWDNPIVQGSDRLSSIASAIEWLKEAHERLRRSISGLDDSELLSARKTNWGALEETRWIIGVTIEHDLYHAGEINHIRCLHQQDDE
jgi:hypothetical protein